jgi:hypothetical protein
MKQRFIPPFCAFVYSNRRFVVVQNTSIFGKFQPLESKRRCPGAGQAKLVTQKLKFWNSLKFHDFALPASYRSGTFIVCSGNFPKTSNSVWASFFG